MRKFNAIIVCVLCGYVCLAVAFWSVFRRQEQKNEMDYKVEANKIMVGLEEKGYFWEPDLHEMKSVQEVAFLPAEDMDEESRVRAFFENKNGVNRLFCTLFTEGKLCGYVRFDYVLVARVQYMLMLSEGILLAAFLFILGILLYVKYKILKPFAVLSEMPYELSKGHLQGELEESGNRFFGKFVWGVGMLRDALISSRAKTLELEKEKKLLLLSLSHDIKIPLSTIKLYAKALKEGIYETEEQKLHAAVQVEVHALAIEKYVKEIAAASSEDIIVIEVENSEFYIKDLVEKIHAVYAPKCRLQMTELEIGNYSNKLLKGDFDRAFEVMENLLENAFKYGDGKRITLHFSEEENCQIIWVINTGEPLPVEELPHIFDSFYRGSNVGNKNGNGLGLYISKRIMQKMDGELFAERKEDGMYFGVVFRM